MAGTIALAPQGRWSVAGWLFDWTVDFLAERVTEPQLRSDLRDIVSQHLGWLGLGDYGPEAEGELRALLDQRLVDAAEAEFAPTLRQRDDAVDLLRQLVSAAA
jgi:hypothetical protein